MFEEEQINKRFTIEEQKIYDSLLPVVESVVNKLSFNQSSFNKSSIVNRVYKVFKKDINEKDEIFNKIIDVILEDNYYYNILGNSNKYAILASERMKKLEKEMIELAGFETDQFILDKNIVQTAINNKKGISDEQQAAVWAACATNRRVTTIEGTAGAGKSFTMQAIKDAYENIGYTVQGAALSWTAAKVLQESAGLSASRAIEGLVRELKKAYDNKQSFFTEPTLLIVDEAGLVGTVHMHSILFYTHHNTAAPVKVVLTGDSLQLNPVAAGNALEAIVNYCGTTRIDTIRRQKQDSHRRAVKLFAKGYAHNALYTFYHQEAINFLKNKEEVFNKVVENFISFKIAFPKKKCLILALKNTDVVELNNLLRYYYQKLGFVEEKEYFLTINENGTVRSCKFAVGDEVVFRKNDLTLPIYNAKEYEEFQKNKSKSIEKEEKVIKEPEQIELFDKFKSVFSLFKKNNKEIIENNSIKIEKDTNKEQNEELKPITLGLFNRMAGKIINIKVNSEEKKDLDLTVLLNDGNIVELNTKKYFDKETNSVPMMHNFATTIYASQGQTVEKVFILDSPMIERRLAYVGMSRHTESCEIFLDCEEIKYRSLNTVKEKATEEQHNIVKRMCIDDLDYLEIISLSWDRESKNQTIMIAKKELMEKRKDRKNKNKKNNAGEIIEIVPKFEEELGETDHCDYLEKIREYYPTVDIKNSNKNNIIYLNNKEIIPSNFTMKVTSEQKGFVKESKYELLYNNEKHKEKINNEYLKALKNIIWDIGPNDEMRIIAKNKKNIVEARYTVDGKMTVGNGLPPIIKNKSATKDTNVVIVTDFEDALITHSFYINKNGENSSENPHIIIALPDCDLSIIYEGIKKVNKINILRNKNKESSTTQAIKIYNELSIFGITNITISPKMENNNKIVL